MLIHNNPLFSISFGDRREQIEPEECKTLTCTSLFSREPFSLFQKQMQLSALVFLHQVHQAKGKIVSQAKEIKNLPLFSEDGDYLITDQRAMGLGIVTADCLPIIYSDKVKRVVGVAHAGWKGSVENIATNVVAALQERFDSRKQDIEVFFGPAAKGCCYKVDEPFLEKVGSGPAVEKALSKKNNQYYFDLGLYNAAQLVSQGFSSQQLVFDYNTCTLCHDTFCSYRRQEGTSARQITVVSLK
jgi:polyphenol oxidase